MSDWFLGICAGRRAYAQGLCSQKCLFVDLTRCHWGCAEPGPEVVFMRQLDGHNLHLISMRNSANEEHRDHDTSEKSLSNKVDKGGGYRPRGPIYLYK